MEAAEALHMNTGTGENSYAKNSSIQSKIISIGKPIIEEALLKMLCTNIPKSMGIADLGCSSGPNAFQVISEIIDIVFLCCQKLNHSCPEFGVFLNDLFGNDFNNIFQSLPTLYEELKRDTGSGFGPCFISGMPGSFYGRLFPRRSLHFVHSSSSLHWLSEAPPSLSYDGRNSSLLNKGKIYISTTSPQPVLEAYALQFQNDFSLFLKARSDEIVPRGRMVLAFSGRKSWDPTTEESCLRWELLAQALTDMATEGLIEEEKIDSFNAPYYAPCAEEVEMAIKKEGTFVIDRLEKFEVDLHEDAPNLDFQVKGERATKSVRAVVEPMLKSHFGGEIMDALFRRYGVLMGNYLSETKAKYVTIVVSLVRIKECLTTNSTSSADLTQLK